MFLIIFSTILKQGQLYVKFYLMFFDKVILDSWYMFLLIRKNQSFLFLINNLNMGTWLSFYLYFSLVIFIVVNVQQFFLLFFYCFAIFLLLVNFLGFQFVVIVTLQLCFDLYLFLCFFMMSFDIVITWVGSTKSIQFWSWFLASWQFFHPTRLFSLAFEIFTTIIGLISGAL